MTDQVLNAEDGCGLILAQGSTPAEDAACVLFPGTDQLADLIKVNGMAQGRLLCLLNPQFKRLEDFSLWQRGKAKEACSNPMPSPNPNPNPHPNPHPKP